MLPTMTLPYINIKGSCYFSFVVRMTWKLYTLKLYCDKITSAVGKSFQPSIKTICGSFNGSAVAGAAMWVGDT